MNINSRINAFVQLGKLLNQFSENNNIVNNTLSLNVHNNLSALVANQHIHNPWFTEQNVRTAILAIATNLEEVQLTNWLSIYIDELKENKKSRRVVVIMAGNIPMVGFHDMLCVLLSGNIFVGKLSSNDNQLLLYFSKLLISIEPEIANFIEFTDGVIKNIDAVIATGSNNSARYFEYYFGKYPCIIRKNRSSVAVLTGNETAVDLLNLGKDVFQYFGLGCRNVSKLFVPNGYLFDTFYQSIIEYQYLINNNKYANNYEYNRTIYLVSGDTSLLDNNFLLLKKDASYASPIGVLFYEYYDDIILLNQKLEKDSEQLQCIVSTNTAIKKAIKFGKTQCPTLSDYADGINTMRFLSEL